MRDACLVFVPDRSDNLLAMLKQNFHETVQLDHSVPYEFKCVLSIRVLAVVFCDES